MPLAELITIGLLGVIVLVAVPFLTRHARNLRRGREDARMSSMTPSEASPSNFTYTRNEQPSEPVGEHRQRALTQDLAQHIPLRVLLAEDTTMNQTLIRHIFARMGYVIEIVNNGLAAVESAREADYDLILMDIQMPGMDGIEACTHILAEASARGTRPPAIVAVTANASVDNRQQCLAAGMCDFIPKPFTLDRLHQVVSRMGDDADSYHVSQVSS